MADLTPYEEQALEQIRTFKEPYESRLGSLWRRANAPLEQLVDRSFDTDAGAAMVRTVQNVADLLNDGASWTVRTGAIYEEFARVGHPGVRGSSDIIALSLEDIDRVVKLLGAKYRALALAQGAASGAWGAVGLAADVVLLVGLALRAVGEYATYHGSDMEVPAERAFAMSILAAASSPTVGEQRSALRDLTKASLQLARRENDDDPGGPASVPVTKKVAQVLAVRLLKAKLGQLIPIAGAVLGGGYNAWYIGAVCDTAHQMYRQRFLLEKHGDEIAAKIER